MMAEKKVSSGARRDPRDPPRARHARDRFLLPIVPLAMFSKYSTLVVVVVVVVQYA